MPGDIYQLQITLITNKKYMSFKGTRQEGRTTGNKSNTRIKESFAELVGNNLDRLQADIDELESKDRLRFIIDLAAYVIPKMRSVDVVNDIENNVRPILVEITTPEQIKAIINDLENKY